MVNSAIVALTTSLVTEHSNSDDINDVACLIERVYRARASQPEYLSQVYADMVEWFNCKWEVTIYEANQYAAEVMTASL